MIETRETTTDRPAPPDPAAGADPVDRYLDLWERNQSEVARRGPPPAPFPMPG